MTTYGVTQSWKKGADNIGPYNRYRLLNEADRSMAVETFQKNKDFYHPICKGLVEKDLFGKGGKS